DTHLARLALADLFLDTGPYGAHTSASDALRAGVPVLTCPGRSFASRVGASLLTAAGLPDLIVENRAAYVGEAVRLGRDPAALAALKARLQTTLPDSALFDPVRFARGLEAAFEAVLCRREPASASLE
ncbi:MAG: tetratricopeptide repeat protein, partial [Sandaracinobacteroides sp.]